MAYARAVAQFLAWCESRSLALGDLQPVFVAAYVEDLAARRSAPTVKQHLAAVRMLFDYLLVGQAFPFNPAQAVRGPKHVIKKGKTPVLTENEARNLLASIDTNTVVGLRDRALIALMVYSFSRVGAAVRMRVKDYYSQGRRAWFILHEKGGKYHQVPAHHKAAEYIDRYLEAAHIADAPASALFRAARGKGRAAALTDHALTETFAWRMVKRRARAAGLPREITCHSFRATGITNYLANGGTLEVAARIAAHESTRTTQLYNRTADALELDEIERIRI